VDEQHSCRQATKIFYLPRLLRHQVPVETLYRYWWSSMLCCLCGISQC